MMIALCAAIALSQEKPSDVSDFFPLVKGTVWTYQDTSNGLTTIYKDSVGNEQPIGDKGGKLATPIVSKVDSDVDGSTFYRVEGDQVLVVAFDQNKPLPNPYPIIKLGSDKNTWQYTGATQWYGELAPLTIKGSTRRTGQKEFFGEKRDTIEVVMDATVGPEGKMGAKKHQVYVYARGIGLVSLRDTTTLDKTKVDRERKLVAFSPGKPD